MITRPALRTAASNEFDRLLEAERSRSQSSTAALAPALASFPPAFFAPSGGGDIRPARSNLQSDSCKAR
jgi:hypothetical protein